MSFAVNWRSQKKLSRKHLSILKRDQVENRIRNEEFIETGNERIDKSDDRLGDQSRCGSTRDDDRNIPACLYRTKARFDS